MFEIEPGKDYGVITGDIIDSSGLTANERKQLPHTVRSAASTLGDWFRDDYGDGAELVSSVAIFGGDSWQLLLRDPRLVLRAGLFMRASLLASPLDIDTRVAIAIGGVDFVPDGKIEQGDGVAFRLSGWLLSEGLSKRVSMAFGAHGHDSADAWSLTIRLIDELVRRNWSSNRSRAMTGALRGWTQKQTGELWDPPIAHQSVGRHLIKAGWGAISIAIRCFEDEY